MIKAVITGDIVHSTDIPSTHKAHLLLALEEVKQDFQAICNLNFEIFRGDSFQFIVERPEWALCLAIAIRTKLKSQTPEGENAWDARISLGLGDVSYVGDNIVTSDGEAFHNSGRKFDSLGKTRLGFLSPWPEMNAEMDLTTAFVDDIVSNLTIKQAAVVYLQIVSPTTQKELAVRLGTTPQNINYFWTKARGSLIEAYLVRYKTLLLQYNT